MFLKNLLGNTLSFLAAVRAA